MISVGIDVSKGKSTVCLMKPGGEVLKRPFDVFHTKPDVSVLTELIKSYNEEARVVLESTGHYHWPIAYALSDEGLFVSVVNPYRMKRFCSQSIRRAKTDKIDSIYIAAFGITYWSELIPLPSKDDICKGSGELQKVIRRQENHSQHKERQDYVEKRFEERQILRQGKSDRERQQKLQANK